MEVIFTMTMLKVRSYCIDLLWTALMLVLLVLTEIIYPLMGVIVGGVIAGIIHFLPIQNANMVAIFAWMMFGFLAYMFCESSHFPV